MLTPAYQTYMNLGKHDHLCRDEPSPHTQQPLQGDLRRLMKQYNLSVVERASACFGPVARSQATREASDVISDLVEAMYLEDAVAIENCFFAGQAFWKDQLAFTWHLRTFITPKHIARALFETQQQRCLTTLFYPLGNADLVQIGTKLVSRSFSDTI